MLNKSAIPSGVTAVTREGEGTWSLAIDISELRPLDFDLCFKTDQKCFVLIRKSVFKDPR